MYFEFYELKSWGKRSANNRRRFDQRLLKGKARAARSNLPDKQARLFVRRQKFYAKHKKG